MVDTISRDEYQVKIIHAPYDSDTTIIKKKASWDACMLRWSIPVTILTTMCLSPKITVSEQWITQSEQILKTMDQNIKKAEKDRLEAITSILYVINAIDRNLHGWRRWVQNLGFMAQFSSEELHQME